MLCICIASAAPREVFNVADYGAAPNTVVDSGPAIRKAIAAAIVSGQPSEVVFGDGAYRLGSIKGGAWWGKAHLVVKGADDIVLRGSVKTVLLMTDPSAAGVVLLSCHNVVAKSLTIDSDPVPQITTKIIGIDPDHAFIEVEQTPGDSDLMTFDHPLFQNPNVHMLTTTYEVLKGGTPICGWEPVGLMVAGATGPHRWKLAIPAQPDHTRSDAISVAGLRVGDLLVSSSFGAGAAFSMIYNKNAEARDITIHASPGLAFFPHGNDSVSLIDCVVERKPGSHRLLSSDIDGIHARGNRTIRIEGCSLADMGDDAINLHASAAVPLARTSPSTIVFRRHTYSVRPGDTLEQVRPETGLVIGKYVVKSVDDTAKDGLHVEFVDALPDVTFGADLSTGDQFFNLSEASGDFIIRNNDFGTHRGRDILIQAYKGVVEHNRFESKRLLPLNPYVSSDPGFDRAMQWLVCTSIQICYDPSWGEGPITQGVTIRDNKFIGNEFRSPAIWIQDHLRVRGRAMTAGSHRDFTIERNQFVNRNAPAVVARLVTNLVVKDNKVTGKGAKMGDSPTDPAFDLQDCVGVTFSGNVAEDGVFTKLVDYGKGNR